VFDAVTGISTGALIAPFAFLGSEYDKPLRDFYTGIATKDILTQRSLLDAISFGSFADTEPLRQLLVKAVSPEMLQAIAREHAKGRRLYIGTANLDAQRPVIWDMGAIACSGRPEAIELFRKVMRASASIPVAFPPQYFDVTADGKAYQEMHADGSTITNVFHFGQMLDYKKMREELKGVKLDEMPRRTWVIRNGLVRPEHENVSPRLMSVAGRSVATLMKGCTAGDLYRIYALCKMEGMEFNLAYIPDDYKSQGKEMFDRAEMNRLFVIAFELAKAGKEWSKTPPGVVADSSPAK
jgi:predicted acylesterase/phospholipase RssA